MELTSKQPLAVPQYGAEDTQATGVEIKSPSLWGTFMSVVACPATVLCSW